MITRSLQRSAARSWRESSSKYGGRSWPLAAVMLCNFTSVVFFGGSLMLFAVALIETVFLLLNPGLFTWFGSEAARALVSYGAIAFFASIFPMLLTAGINRLYRRRCRSCGR